MNIAGLQKMTLIDYPGKIACTIFTRGCNLRCPYCHNPELIELGGSEDLMPEEGFFSFLETREKFLDGVCITGGEPTLQHDIEDFAIKVKEMGYLVKLDTNGTRPDVISSLINRRLLDYIAMDVKTSPVGYISDLGFNGSIKDLNRSISIIRNSKVEHEFRTTVVPGLIGKEELHEIGKMIKGSACHYIQNFRPGFVFDPKLSGSKGYPLSVLEEFEDIMKNYVPSVDIRN